MNIKTVAVAILGIISFNSTMSASIVDVENCTLDTCKQAYEELQSRILKLNATNAPELLPYVTKGDMKKFNLGCSNSNPTNDESAICLKGKTGAESYCKSIGARIPSIYDWALIAQSHGAKGILTQKEYNEEQSSPGKNELSQIIFRTGFDKSVDRFYYSSENYVDPEKDMPKISFWSSSMTMARHNSSTNDYYVLKQTGNFNSIGAIPLNGKYSAAIRCVRDK